MIRSIFTKKEIPLLYEIEKECFAPAFRWSKKIFIDQIKKQNIWIYENDEQIVGFLLAFLRKGKGYISSMEVLPAFQGQGYGKLLMEACHKYFKEQGCKEMSLDVNTKNPAQILYFKMGYRTAGFKRNFYKQGSHGLYMIKSL